MWKLHLQLPLSAMTPPIIVMDGEGKGKSDGPCLLTTYLWTVNSLASDEAIIPSLELPTRTWATHIHTLLRPTDGFLNTRRGPGCLLPMAIFSPHTSLLPLSPLLSFPGLHQKGDSSPPVRGGLNCSWPVCVHHLHAGSTISSSLTSSSGSYS